MNIEKFPARLPAIALRNQVLVFDDTLTPRYALGVHSLNSTRHITLRAIDYRPCYIFVLNLVAQTDHIESTSMEPYAFRASLPTW